MSSYFYDPFVRETFLKLKSSAFLYARQLIMPGVQPNCEQLYLVYYRVRRFLKASRDPCGCAF